MSVQSTSKFTLNLSDTCLSSEILQVLDRGLTFIPTYQLQPLDQIYNLQHRLVRNIKLKDFFSNRDIDNDSQFDYTVETFRTPSTWIPPDRKISQCAHRLVSDIVETTELLVSGRRVTDKGCLCLVGQTPNVTPRERTIIKELKRNTDLVIKPADKGSAVVVMNRTNYIQEGYRQLLNTKYYRKLDAPVFYSNIPKINAILRDMYDRGFIDDRQLAYLSASESDRQRRFYMLPKIHKPAEKWAQPGKMPDGRPIVSDSGSESCRVAAYVNSFLRPLANQHPAYLKDTYDFVAKVRGKHVPKGALLVTADVTSLYTNMTIDRMVETVREAFRRSPVAGRPDDHLIALLEYTLKHNDFTFNGEVFLQICGTAMGKSYAPSLADLYLEFFDQQARTGHRVAPLLYFRYIDDVFLVWTSTVEELLDFQSFLNGLIPGIQVNFEYSEVSVHFLDTTVYLADCADSGDCTLETRVYFKATDTHQLLEKRSFHPPHTCKGVLKSQFVRFKRICSTKADFDCASTTLMDALAARHYSKRLMRQVKAEVWNNFQPRALAARDKPQVMPIIVPFNEFGVRLGRAWRNAISSSGLFEGYQLITAYTVGLSLHRILVSSLLPGQTQAPAGPLDLVPVRTATTHTDVPQPVSGCQHCGHPKCKACSFVVDSTTVTSTSNGNLFSIRGPITCRSCNVVYLITCNRCHLQYVGETGRCLADRLNDHLSCVRTNKPTPVGLHFNLAGHCLRDLTIQGIEALGDSSDAHYRRVKEQVWTILMGTVSPLGLNQPLAGKRKY